MPAKSRLKCYLEAVPQTTGGYIGQAYSYLPISNYLKTTLRAKVVFKARKTRDTREAAIKDAAKWAKEKKRAYEIDN